MSVDPINASMPGAGMIPSVAATHVAPVSPVNSASAFSRSGNRIVALDDDPMTLHLLRSHLSKAQFTIKTAANGSDGLKLITDETAVALVDLRMPGMSGFEIIQHLQKKYPAVQVVVLTSSSEISDAVRAMREGAFQFISKPFDPNELIVTVEKAIGAHEVASENKRLKSSHSHNVLVREPELTGDIQTRLMQQVNQIANLNATVFIGGETGTGKSTIARLIHQKSDRSDGPFVTVNCASLPRDLIQSELFGHKKGAFTGAVDDRLGHAAVADGGTLFLDEIGDLPLELQPKLLTFLQDRTIQRIGETKVTKVDVRLITATHRDLTAMQQSGVFRQDLYFRLMVLNLEMPALRFRLGDLPGIAHNIIHSMCERQSLPVKRISQSAMDILVAHSWPGNIRELENVLERALAFSQTQSIQPGDLFLSDVGLDRRKNGPRVSSTNIIPTERMIGNVEANHSVEEETPQIAKDRTPTPTRVSSTITTTDHASMESRSISSSLDQAYPLAGKTLEEIEREAILQTLESLNGNKAKSARTLGISEKSIYNKMRRLNIKWPKTC